MSEFEGSPEVTTDQQPEVGNTEDVIAGIAVISVAILAAIHFVYSDGLLGFFELLF